MSDNNYEYALVTYLKTDSALNALIGDSIFPNQGFEGAPYPCITYQIINDSQVNNLTSADDLTWIYYQFTIYTDTANDRRTIGERLRLLLNGKLNSGLTYLGGSAILSSSWMMSGTKDSYHSPPDSSETGYFERRLTFRMCFKQTIPTF